MKKTKSPPLPSGGGGTSEDRGFEGTRERTNAHLHHPPASLQHRRPDRRELHRLHARREGRRRSSRIAPVTPNVDQAGLERIAEEKHLNDSVFVRYGYWVRDAVTNEFGDTLLTNKPILPDLWRVMKNTLQLVIVAEFLAILIAIGIGVLSALRQYSEFDYTATTFSFLGLAMPVFWLALMLQVLDVQIQSWTGYKIFPIASLNDVDPGSGISFWSTAPTTWPCR